MSSDPTPGAQAHVEPGQPARQGTASSPPAEEGAPSPLAWPAQLGGLDAHYVGVSPADAPAVAVLLHGFGDRGDGLVPLARELLLSQPRLAVVALAGRLARPEGGRMWWPIDIERVRSARLRGAWPELERQRPPGADEAQAAVVAALRELARRGVLHERVVLAGFSQGAMLAVDVGLAHPELLRGVVAWSGAVLDRERWEQSPPAGVSFIVSHGQRDTVLPFAQGEGLHSLLRRVDPDARWVPFDGPHTVSADGRAALLELLADHNSPP